MKTHVAPVQADIAATCPKLHLRVEYLNELFEAAYPTIKRFLEQGRYRSVIFNLDQCGHSHVERNTILDIMHSYPAAGIFYTFVISSLLAFLQKDQPDRLRAQLDHLGLRNNDVQALEGMMNQKDWLGTAEKIVFDAFRLCAPYVSPFSINNPGGWRYWLIHFANAYRARQVYNNILHDNASLQAHFGRSGLNMLSYDPRHDEGTLYLFDDSGRASAKTQLLGDIPRLVTDAGDAMSVMEFYESIYNVTHIVSQPCSAPTSRRIVMHPLVEQQAFHPRYGHDIRGHLPSSTASCCPCPKSPHCLKKKAVLADRH